MTDTKPNPNWYDRTITDIEVICEIPTPRIWGVKYGEPDYWKKLDKELQSEANEFLDFIRDHRSRDDISMTTRKVYSIRCKYCGESYDVQEPGGLVPGCCDEAMKHTGYIVSEDEG